MDHPRRRRTTAALIAIAAVMAFAGPAAAMTFEMMPAPESGAALRVLATGSIDKDSVEQFQAFVREHHIARGDVVVLNSEGGVLLYALALGEQIRKDGLSTTVPDITASGSQQQAECASACVFSFMGGVQRTVGKGARLGVHQIYADSQAHDALSVGDAQWLASRTAEHIDRMGGRVGILVLALNTPPQTMHWFSPSELDQLGVVTR